MPTNEQGNGSSPPPPGISPAAAPAVQPIIGTGRIMLPPPPPRPIHHCYCYSMRKILGRHIGMWNEGTPAQLLTEPLSLSLCVCVCDCDVSGDLTRPTLGVSVDQGKKSVWHQGPEVREGGSTYWESSGRRQLTCVNPQLGKGTKHRSASCSGTGTDALGQ